MADLPSGAVTFLFTDIEGSTRLVRQLRSRYAEILAEHQRLIRLAFSQHGGHELDTQGDAFFDQTIRNEPSRQDTTNRVVHGRRGASAARPA